MIESNAKSIPESVKVIVGAFAVIAVFLDWGAYSVNRVLGNYLWDIVGIVLVVIAIYLFVLRARPKSE